MSGPQDLFLRAARGESTERVPVWIMRQAGRYLPEYRALKEKHDFLTLCKTPELAAEVTLQPVRRLGVDAAILFSDILIPLEPMGLGLRFDPGPVLDRAINSEQAIAGLLPVDVQASCGFVADAIRILRRELKVPLIGFCGAPFTLAAYLAEEREKGKTKGTFDTIVRLIFERPDLAHKLLRSLSRVMTDYLTLQIQAGAQAVQIFDSWGGILGAEEFREFALPYVQQIIRDLPAERGPVIYFVLGGGHLLPCLRDSGADVIGIDWRTSLRAAHAQLGSLVVQGNLDPRALFAPPERLEGHVRRVLADGRADGDSGGCRGHIMNLGHGILPDTPLSHAQLLVELTQTIGVSR